MVEIILGPSHLKAACDELGSADVLGLDCETTDLDPMNGRLRLLQLSNGDKTYVLDLDTVGDVLGPALKPIRDLLTSPDQIKVAHNAKFDIKWIKYHLGVEVENVFDTYMASVLLAAGARDRRHGLKDVARLWLDVEVDKEQQKSDWSDPSLTEEQIRYAAEDAAALPRLYHKMYSALVEDRLLEVMEVENRCLMPVAQMELNGICLNVDGWRSLLQWNIDAAAVHGEELMDMLAPGARQPALIGRPEINLGSTKQVIGNMKRMGIPLDDTTQEWKIEPLGKEYPAVAKLLEYRGYAKHVSSFGESILAHVRPDTGRIHATYKLDGAENTGRFSCTSPNLQQMPHGSKVRACFTADVGNRLVIADYSQIELRILADRSGDEKFIAAFNSGADFHRTTAAEVFGVSVDEVSDEQRSFAKRLNFGLVYGISAHRFSLLTGMDIEEVNRLMYKYFSTYSGLDAYLKESGRDVVIYREARTASGRLSKLAFDENQRGQAASAKRAGINMPIQGTSADILKRALRLAHDSFKGTSGRLVNIVHDEILAEASIEDVDVVAERLADSMRTAGEVYIKKVPVVVDPVISEVWAK